jgi:hypothetical protein
MKNTINKIIISIFAVLAFVLIAPSAHASYVTTAGVSNVTQSSATLNGLYTLGTSSAEVYFEYANNSGFFGSQKTTRSTVTGSNSTSVTISGLNPETRYYYRLIAEGSMYESGGVLNFTTLSSPISSKPSVTTAGSKDITGTSATILGLVSSNASNTWFEYGTTTSLGNTISATVSNSQASGYLSGLNVNTRYYYKLVSENNAGRSDGSILSFTTSGTTPPPAGTCYINSFYANSSYVNLGSSTYLVWNTTNCTSVSISYIGSVPTTSSNYAITPYSTTTYTMTASSANGSDIKSVTISVGNGSGCLDYYSCNSYSYNYSQYPTYYRGYAYGAPSYAYQDNTYGYGYTSSNNSSGNYSNSSNSKSNVKGTSTNSSSDTSKSDSSDTSNLSASAGLAGGHFFPGSILGWLALVALILILVIAFRMIVAKRHNSNTHH